MAPTASAAFPNCSDTRRSAQKWLANAHVLMRVEHGGRYTHTIETDHVIAAHGYRPGLDRLTFIQPGLRASIRSLVDTPILSSHFHLSVAGLYFVGPIAANSFGPTDALCRRAPNTAARRLSPASRCDPLKLSGSRRRWRRAGVASCVA